MVDPRSIPSGSMGRMHFKIEKSHLSKLSLHVHYTRLIHINSIKRRKKRKKRERICGVKRMNHEVIGLPWRGSLNTCA